MSTTAPAFDIVKQSALADELVRSFATTNRFAFFITHPQAVIDTLHAVAAFAAGAAASIIMSMTAYEIVRIAPRRLLSRVRIRVFSMASPRDE